MIYIINHTDKEIPIMNNYKELKVGPKYEDNGRDNINYLNPYINEATGLYDIWKNTTDDIVGLVHYRRIFEDNGDYLTIERAEEILKDYDIILTEEYYPHENITAAMKCVLLGDEQVLDKYINKIGEKEPNYKEYMKSKYFNPCEMFVAKRDAMDKYCEWVFDLMIPLAEEFKNDQVINKRLLGYLFEELLTYYCQQNNLKVYTMKVKYV